MKYRKMNWFVRSIKGSTTLDYIEHFPNFASTIKSICIPVFASLFNILIDVTRLAVGFLSKFLQ